MQKHFDLIQFLINCLLKTNFFEGTLGNLTSTNNFVDLKKNKKDFLFKKILTTTKKSRRTTHNKGKTSDT